MPKITMLKSVQKRIDKNRQYFWAGETFDVTDDVAKEFVTNGYARYGAGGNVPAVPEVKTEETFNPPGGDLGEESTEEETEEEETEETDEEEETPEPGVIVDDPAPKFGRRGGGRGRRK